MSAQHTPTIGDKVAVGRCVYRVLRREDDPRRSTYGWYECALENSWPVGSITYLSAAQVSAGLQPKAVQS